MPLLELKEAYEYTIPSFSVITVDVRRVRYQVLGSPKRRMYSTRALFSSSLQVSTPRSPRLKSCRLLLDASLDSPLSFSGQPGGVVPIPSVALLLAILMDCLHNLCHVPESVPLEFQPRPQFRMYFRAFLSLW